MDSSLFPFGLDLHGVKWSEVEWSGVESRWSGVEWSGLVLKYAHGCTLGRVQWSPYGLWGGQKSIVKSTSLESCNSIWLGEFEKIVNKLPVTAV